MNRAGRCTTMILVGTLTITGALAAAAGRAEGRFDSYHKPRQGGVLATAPQDVASLDAADQLRRGWDGFRGRHGGRWNVFVDERSAMPTLVTGSGIRWIDEAALDTITLDSIEAAARAFVADHVSLLGGAGDWLMLDRDGSGELRPGYWKLVFRQHVDGIVVENSRLEFHVDGGKLTMFGASNWSPPPIDAAATVTAEEARAIVDGYLDGASAGFELTSDPELHLIAVDADRKATGPKRWTGPRGRGVAHVLVWRVSLQDPEAPAIWVGEVDARDGSLVGFYDGAHYAGIKGGVYPEQPSGDCAVGGCELDDFPMPFADWTVSGGTEANADAYGNFTCADPDATFSTILRGKYVQVDDSCGPVYETARCGDDLHLGVKTGENCDIDPALSPGNTGATRTSYYHVNRVAEAARFYNPTNNWLQGRNITLYTNWFGHCNASYGNNGIYVYISSSICDNTGEIQGIAVHEWGHGYDFNDGGGEDHTSEAYADMVSMFASRESCFGPGMFIDGRTCSGYGDACLTCTGFRDWDFAQRTENTPATPQDFVQNRCDPGTGTAPCGGQVHCEAYPIDESMYDFAYRDLPASGVDPDTAWQLAERLWYSSRIGSGGDMYNCALPASDSCAAGNLYQQLRAADDDDADLSNGTPHAAALFAAFDRHNIACGLATDPENQSTSSCPTLDAPVVTVTAVPNGTEIGWTATAGAEEYLVLRGDMGCNKQQIPVATVPAGTTTWLDAVGDPDVMRYYRVEAIGANPVCRSPVSNCDTSPAGPRIQKNAHRLIDTGSLGNGTGAIDPGETVEIPITLFNGGTADAVGVTARLRTVDPDHGRAVVPTGSWPDLAVYDEFESDVPHIELTLFRSGIACGETVPVELEMWADNAAVRRSTFGFKLGDKSRFYDKVDSQELSRFVTDPVVSTFDVTDDTVLADLDIRVNIDHTSPVDLIVELTSPEGTTVRLHDLSPGIGGGGIFTRYDLETQPDGPGTMADFGGENLAGTWSLSVQNTRFGGGSGNLGGWALFVESVEAFGCEPYECGDPAPAAPATNLTVDKTGADLTFAWDALAGAAGYHVLHSTSPAYDTAVDLTGLTSGATTLTVVGGVPLTPDLAFFQVRGSSTCNQEGP